MFLLVSPCSQGLLSLDDALRVLPLLPRLALRVEVSSCCRCYCCVCVANGSTPPQSILSIDELISAAPPRLLRLDWLFYRVTLFLARRAFERIASFRVGLGSFCIFCAFRSRVTLALCAVRAYHRQDDVFVLKPTVKRKQIYTLTRFSISIFRFLAAPRVSFSLALVDAQAD